jgi:TolA-binding protein
MRTESQPAPDTPTDPYVVEARTGLVQEEQALPVQPAPVETTTPVQPASAGRFDQMVAEYTRLYAQVQLGLHRELEDQGRQLAEHGSRAEELDRQLAVMKEHAAQLEAMQQRLETFREGHEITAQRIEDLRGQVEFTPLFGRQVPLRTVAIVALAAAILSVLVAVVAVL